MTIEALLVAVVAIVLFTVEAWRTRSLIAAGLAVLAFAWVLQLAHPGKPVTF